MGCERKRNQGYLLGLGHKQMVRMDLLFTKMKKTEEAATRGTHVCIKFEMSTSIQMEKFRRKLKYINLQFRDAAKLEM